MNRVKLFSIRKMFLPNDGDSSGYYREEKKAEKALEFANAYNRSLIEASLDPLVTIGLTER